MSRYRIYVLNWQDRIARTLEETFANDREALELAEDLGAGQYAAEVWKGDSLIARLGGVLRLA